MDMSELFRAERVCRRWKSVISEFVWSRVTRVDDTIIDYPYGNFVQRFMALCHRVEYVQHVFAGVSAEWTRGRSKAKRKEAMKDALLQVLKKLSPGTALPLSLVEQILLLKHPVEKRADPAPIAQVRGQVTQVLHDIGAGELDAIRVGQLWLTTPESALDPFSVKYHGNAYPMVSAASRITRLDIGSLVALTAAEDPGGLTASHHLVSWLQCFPRLHTVLLEQVDFLKPAAVPNASPVLTIRIHFRPQRCRLRVDEFVSFLRALGEGKAFGVRTRKIATLVDEWKTKDWIERCEFAIHTVDSSSFLFDINVGGYPCCDDDATRSLLGRLFLSPLTRKLHIDLYHQDEAHDLEDQLLLQHLHAGQVLGRLSEFSASFAPDDGRERASDWDDGLATHVVLLLLRSLSGSLKNLDTLKLDFARRVCRCPRDLLKPLKVAGPLPHLRDVRCEGLPCFPFIVSLVQQAPNLRCLLITSQPVDDEHATVEWISTLLRALERSAHLSILAVRVQATCQCYDTVSFKRDRESTAALEEQVQRVIASSAQLHRVSIHIGDLHFQLNRYGASDRLLGLSIPAAPCPSPSYAAGYCHR